MDGREKKTSGEECGGTSCCCLLLVLLWEGTLLLSFSLFLSPLLGVPSSNRRKGKNTREFGPLISVGGVVGCLERWRRKLVKEKKRRPVDVTVTRNLSRECVQWMLFNTMTEEFAQSSF